MLTKEKLRQIRKYLTAYQTTTGEFLDDCSEYNRQELNDLIGLLQSEIHDPLETPINLKPCKDGEVFWTEAGYCEELDMTFIIRNKLKNGAVIGEEVCGFYHGEPDDRFIDQYTNKTYWEFDENWVKD